MSEALDISTEKLDDQIIVKFKGSIDEDSTFDQILSTEFDQYVFDFDQVDMINSCGVREWIDFIEKLPEQSTIVYKHCPQVVIEQINMVQGFIKKGAKVDSFYAPYYNENNDEVQKVLLKTQDIQNGKAPKKIDKDTGDELEFDAIEAQYFNFLKQIK